MRKAYKKAIRKKAKEQGAYDGRFAPRVEKDLSHEKDKYLCREDVEVPEEDEDVDLFGHLASEDINDQDEWEEDGFGLSLGDVLD